MQLFSDDGSIKNQHKFRREYNLHENSYFRRVQLVVSIQERWRLIIKKIYENATNIIIHNPQISN